MIFELKLNTYIMQSEIFLAYSTHKFQLLTYNTNLILAFIYS